LLLILFHGLYVIIIFVYIPNALSGLIKGSLIFVKTIIFTRKSIFLHRG